MLVKTRSMRKNSKLEFQNQKRRTSHPPYKLKQHLPKMPKIKCCNPFDIPKHPVSKVTQLRKLSDAIIATLNDSKFTKNSRICQSCTVKCENKNKADDSKRKLPKVVNVRKLKTRVEIKSGIAKATGKKSGRILKVRSVKSIDKAKPNESNVPKKKPAEVINKSKDAEKDGTRSSNALKRKASEIVQKSKGKEDNKSRDSSPSKTKSSEKGASKSKRLKGSKSSDKEDQTRDSAKSKKKAPESVDPPASTPDDDNDKSKDARSESSDESQELVDLTDEDEPIVIRSRLGPSQVLSSLSGDVRVSSCINPPDFLELSVEELSKIPNQPSTSNLPSVRSGKVLKTMKLKAIEKMLRANKIMRRKVSNQSSTNDAAQKFEELLINLKRAYNSTTNENMKVSILTLFPSWSYNEILNHFDATLQMINVARRMQMIKGFLPILNIRKDVLKQTSIECISLT